MSKPIPEKEPLGVYLGTVIPFSFQSSMMELAMSVARLFTRLYETLVPMSTTYPPWLYITGAEFRVFFNGRVINHVPF